MVKSDDVPHPPNPNGPPTTHNAGEAQASGESAVKAPAATTSHKFRKPPPRVSQGQTSPESADAGSKTTPTSAPPPGSPKLPDPTPDKAPKTQIPRKSLEKAKPVQHTFRKPAPKNAPRLSQDSSTPDNPSVPHPGHTAEEQPPKSGTGNEVKKPSLAKNQLKFRKSVPFSQDQQNPSPDHKLQKHSPAGESPVKAPPVKKPAKIEQKPTEHPQHTNPEPHPPVPGQKNEEHPPPSPEESGENEVKAVASPTSNKPLKWRKSVSQKQSPLQEKDAPTSDNPPPDKATVVEQSSGESPEKATSDSSNSLKFRKPVPVSQVQKPSQGSVSPEVPEPDKHQKEHPGETRESAEKAKGDKSVIAEKPLKFRKSVPIQREEKPPEEDLPIPVPTPDATPGHDEVKGQTPRSKSEPPPKPLAKKPLPPKRRKTLPDIPKDQEVTQVTTAPIPDPTSGKEAPDSDKPVVHQPPEESPVKATEPLVKKQGKKRQSKSVPPLSNEHKPPDNTTTLDLDPTLEGQIEKDQSQPPRSKSEGTIPPPGPLTKKPLPLKRRKTAPDVTSEKSPEEVTTPSPGQGQEDTAAADQPPRSKSDGSIPLGKTLTKKPIPLKRRTTAPELHQEKAPGDLSSTPDKGQNVLGQTQKKTGKQLWGILREHVESGKAKGQEVQEESPVKAEPTRAGILWGKVRNQGSAPLKSGDDHDEEVMEGDDNDLNDLHTDDKQGVKKKKRVTLIDGDMTIDKHLEREEAKRKSDNAKLQHALDMFKSTHDVSKMGARLKELVKTIKSMNIEPEVYEPFDDETPMITTYAKGAGFKDDEDSEEETKMSTFDDLVMYNEEGKPYIDANKLIYSPRLRRSKEGKEKLSWYLPDYIFIVCNLLSLVTLAHALALGVQLMFWDPSIAAVTRTDPENGNGNGTILRFKVTTDPNQEPSPGAVGLFLATLALISGINFISGIIACTSGYRLLLKLHAFIDIILVLSQIILAILVIVFGTCDLSDMLGFQEGFEFMVRSFAEPKKFGPEGEEQYHAITLLDEVQVSMQCCGASNWTDYLSSRVTYIENDFETGRIMNPLRAQRVFPYSCCKAWWVRNIHCAVGVHIWIYPNTSRLDVKRFRERIYEVGCGPRIWLSCKRLLLGLGQGLFMMCFLAGIILVLELYSICGQLRNLNRAIKEHQSVKLMRLGTFDDTSDNEKEKEEPEPEVKTEKDRKSAASINADNEKKEKNLRMKEINELKSMLAPPTEDEIQYIKKRTNFAQFELRMKHTNIGRLLQEARKAMEPSLKGKGQQGQGDEVKDTDISKKEEEEHLREKELRAATHHGRYSLDGKTAGGRKPLPGGASLEKIHEHEGSHPEKDAKGKRPSLPKSESNLPSTMKRDNTDIHAPPTSKSSPTLPTGQGQSKGQKPGQGQSRKPERFKKRKSQLGSARRKSALVSSPSMNDMGPAEVQPLPEAKAVTEARQAIKAVNKARRKKAANAAAKAAEGHPNAQKTAKASEIAEDLLHTANKTISSVIDDAEGHKVKKKTKDDEEKAGDDKRHDDKHGAKDKYYVVDETGGKPKSGGRPRSADSEKRLMAPFVPKLPPHTAPSGAPLVIPHSHFEPGERVHEPSVKLKKILQQVHDPHRAPHTVNDERVTTPKMGAIVKQAQAQQRLGQVGHEGPPPEGHRWGELVKRVQQAQKAGVLGKSHEHLDPDQGQGHPVPQGHSSPQSHPAAQGQAEQAPQKPPRVKVKRPHTTEGLRLFSGSDSKEDEDGILPRRKTVPEAQPQSDNVSIKSETSGTGKEPTTSPKPAKIRPKTQPPDPEPKKKGVIVPKSIFPEIHEAKHDKPWDASTK